MANLVQVAEELEYVPKEQLIEMSQSPDSRYPQYLVLSEIQRRTQMEKMYNAQSIAMNQPQKTVAEEVVGNFSQPQGLAGMNVNGSANADSFSPGSSMPASPMQMAAIGGRTGFQTGNSTTYDPMAASYGTNTRDKTDEELEEERLGFGAGIYETLKDRYTQQNEKNIETKRQQDALVKKAAETSPYDTVMGGLAGAGKFIGVLDEEGKIDPVGAGLAALSVHPAFRATKWLGQGAMKLAPQIGKGLRGLKDYAARPFTKVKKTVTTKGGKKYDVDSEQGKAYLKRKAGKDAAKQGRTNEKRIFDFGKASKNIGTVAAGTAVLREVSDYAQENPNEPEAIENNKDAIISKGASLAGDNPSSANKGLLGKVNSYLDQTDGLDIAALGGIIMGAKNMSEFGQGITAFAKDVQTRRAGTETEARLKALSDMQGAYYKAQIDEMPAEQLTDALKSYAAYAKAIADGSMAAPSKEELKQFQDAYNALLKKQSKMQGIDVLNFQENNDQEVKNLLTVT